MKTKATGILHLDFPNIIKNEVSNIGCSIDEVSAQYTADIIDTMLMISDTSNIKGCSGIGYTDKRRKEALEDMINKMEQTKEESDFLSALTDWVYNETNPALMTLKSEIDRFTIENKVLRIKKAEQAIEHIENIRQNITNGFIGSFEDLAETVNHSIDNENINKDPDEGYPEFGNDGDD